jgi:hypothetical protein
VKAIESFLAEFLIAHPRAAQQVAHERAVANFYKRIDKPRAWAGRLEIIRAEYGDVGADELEWMRDADCVLVDGTFWTEDEINARLDKIMVGALTHIWDVADRHRISLRTATFAVACERILTARQERGLYP